MLARESLALNLPSGVIGIFVGLSLGFVVGLFYYQTYRKNYYWLYSIGSSIFAAAIAPLVMSYGLKMDPSTLHATVIQFSLAFVATILTNHVLYELKKQHTKHRKLHRSRSHSHSQPAFQTERNVTAGHSSVPGAV